MELSIKNKTSHEIIEYLLKSKKEVLQEIKNDVQTEEFQNALQILRAKNKQNEKF